MDHINSGMEDIAGHFGFNRLRVRYHHHYYYNDKVMHRPSFNGVTWDFTDILSIFISTDNKYRVFDKLIWRTIGPKSFLFGTAQFSLWGIGAVNNNYIVTNTLIPC